MRAAVSILLAAIVTVHSVGGFCWQCAETRASCSTCPVATAVCDCHQKTATGGDGDSVGDSNSECELECTGTCRYLNPVRVTFDQPADTHWVAVLPPEFVVIPGRSVFDDFERTVIARGGHPPLRLHLFHGLLLI